ncbi:MAG: YkvA family protein [Pseudomonadota bacterium]|nr:YkvA family protein [Pseudomonadota bacterium]
MFDWIKRRDAEGARTEKALAQQRSRAAGYLQDPQRAQALVNEAREKTEQVDDDGPLGRIWEDLLTMIRLLQRYISGQYRSIPWQSLLLIAGGLLYFVTPIDAMPDFISGLGLLDDATVLMFVIQRLRGELDRFRHWEGREPAPDRESRPPEKPSGE